MSNTSPRGIMRQYVSKPSHFSRKLSRISTLFSWSSPLNQWPCSFWSLPGSSGAWLFVPLQSWHSPSRGSLFTKVITCVFALDWIHLWWVIVSLLEPVVCAGKHMSDYPSSLSLSIDIKNTLERKQESTKPTSDQKCQAGIYHWPLSIWPHVASL